MPGLLGRKHLRSGAKASTTARYAAPSPGFSGGWFRVLQNIPSMIPSTFDKPVSDRADPRAELLEAGLHLRAQPREAALHLSAQRREAGLRLPAQHTKIFTQPAAGGAARCRLISQPALAFISPRSPLPRALAFISSRSPLPRAFISPRSPLPKAFISSRSPLSPAFISPRSPLPRALYLIPQPAVASLHLRANFAHLLADAANRRQGSRAKGNRRHDDRYQLCAHVHLSGASAPR